MAKFRIRKRKDLPGFEGITWADVPTQEAIYKFIKDTHKEEDKDSGFFSIVGIITFVVVFIILPITLCAGVYFGGWFMQTLAEKHQYVAQQTSTTFKFNSSSITTTAIGTIQKAVSTATGESGNEKTSASKSLHLKNLVIFMKNIQDQLLREARSKDVLEINFQNVHEILESLSCKREMIKEFISFRDAVMGVPDTQKFTK